ncbi:MAG: ribosomal-processing cysteine protease Prp [Treponema sp.]|nr:ribosomal-processing cysteine protease Prp [Treponema sp.]
MNDVIVIDVVLDNAGILKACKASGHSGAAKAGNDIVCAAVSVLLRTALSVLSGRQGIKVKGGAPERGELWLEADYTAEGKDFLFAAGEFLIDGLKSISQEFPKNCKLTINKT